MILRIISLLIFNFSEFTKGDKCCGLPIGSFTSNKYGVTGIIFGINDSNILLNNFSFDGPIADIVFWVSDTSTPSTNGTAIHPLNRLPKSSSETDQLTDITAILTLPHELSLKNIQSIAVWSLKDNESYGEIEVSANYELPHPEDIGFFSQDAHLATGNIEIIDASSIRINDIYYSKVDVDEHFIVGLENESNIEIINDENGTFNSLGTYDHQSIILKLQTASQSLTICDIAWLGIGTLNSTSTINRITIPQRLNVPVTCSASQTEQLYNTERVTHLATASTIYPITEEITQQSNDHFIQTDNLETTTYEYGDLKKSTLINNETATPLTTSSIEVLTTLNSFSNIDLNKNRFGHMNYDSSNSSPMEKFSENINWKNVPVSIGSLSDKGKQVFGDVEVIDGYTIKISNFSNKGFPQGVNFLIGTGLYPSSSNGTVIADHLGRFETFSQLESPEVELVLVAENNKKISICEIDWISIYSLSEEINMGHVNIPQNLSLCPTSKFNYKKTRYQNSPLQNIIGGIITLGHSVRSGEIEIIDDYTLKIPFFNYDGNGESTVFWIGEGDKPSSNGYEIADELGQFGNLRSYNMETIKLSLHGLENNYSICNLDWLSVYSTKHNTDYGHVMIPKHIPFCSKQPKSIQSSPVKRDQDPNVAENCCGSMDLINIITTENGIRASVFALNNITLIVRDFFFNGSISDVSFWIDVEPKLSANGFRVKKFSSSTIDKQENGSFYVTLPAGMQLKQFQSFGIWSESLNKSFGEVSFHKDFRAPGPNIIGTFSSLLHGVRTSKVIIMSATTIKIPQLFYDGNGPKAFFYIGRGPKPSSSSGIKIADEYGSFKRLQRYNGKTVTLKLQSQTKMLTVCDIDWISILNPERDISYGHTMIPKQLHIPSSCTKAEFESDEDIYDTEENSLNLVNNDFNLVTEESGEPNVQLKIDTQRDEGKLPKPTQHEETTLSTTEIRLTTSLQKEKLYESDMNSNKTSTIKKLKKTIVNERTDKQLHDDDKDNLFDDEVDDNNESVSKQSNNLEFNNCLTLTENFEVRWKVDKNNITIELTGKIGEYDYMAFGISGVAFRTEVKGSDITVVAHNKNYGTYVEDYIPNGVSACINKQGLCPAIQYPNGKTFSYPLNAIRVDGITSVKYTRPLNIYGSDMHRDYNLFKKNTVVWLLGSFDARGFPDVPTIMSTDILKINLTQTHENKCKGLLKEQQIPHLSEDKTATESVLPTITLNSSLGITDNIFTEFPPLKQSTLYDKQVDKNTTQATTVPITIETYSTTISILTTVHSKLHTSEKHWIIPNITGDTVKTFTAQIGPAGKEKGYQGITGQSSWGIAWYINDLLIPELILQRGTTYKFVVEGGNNIQKMQQYHPLYITNNSEGGYAQKKAEESKNETIFAGGEKFVGRLCERKLNNSDVDSNSFHTFADYFKQLSLKCENGSAGSFDWTPDKNTPDLVYYQCYTHRHLGWKIHIVDRI